jgi:peptidoglycan/xylan/chitin deacetylase (PgdA/CDA1 family)
MPSSGLQAALSFDLDNLWSYLKTHGDPGWEEFPSYFDRLIPEVLEFLDRRKIRLTFFIVGKDAALPKNGRALAALVSGGHDVGNHSFHHEPWLHLQPAPDIAREVEDAEAAIVAATGLRPKGFRGPGFSWNPALLSILAGRGYLYDASSLPTFLGPLGRRYYFAKARLSAQERSQRRNLFGGFGPGFLPSGPYLWRLPGDSRLLEIPVTTTPAAKLPFHLSYLLFLGQRSPAAMRLYLKAALAACRAAGIGPSFLLHPLDFLGAGDAPGLAFFPAMALDKSRKLRLAAEAFAVLTDAFACVSLDAKAEALARRSGSLKVRTPRPERGLP